MFLQFLVLLIYALPFYLVIHPLTQYLLFLGGLVAGRLFLLLDEKLFFKFYQNDEQAKSESNTETAFSPAQMVSTTLNKQPTYVTRSVIFMLAYVGLAFYMVTSGGNRLAQGLVLGMGLSLLVEMWQKRNMPVAFNQYFLSQLKISLDKKAVAKIILAMFCFLLILTVKVL